MCLLASSTLDVVSAVRNVKWSNHRRLRLDAVYSGTSVSVDQFCHRVQPCELLGTVEQQTPLCNKHIGDNWQHKTIFPVVHFTEWPSSFDFWSCDDCPKVCCCSLQKVRVAALFSYSNLLELPLCWHFIWWFIQKETGDHNKRYDDNRNQKFNQFILNIFQREIQQQHYVNITVLPPSALPIKIDLFAFKCIETLVK